MEMAMSGGKGKATALYRAVPRNLIPWFCAHQRVMPWRQRRTPYRVWVSEIMLQQTRVDTVTPYFRRWMQQFPSLKTLAEAHIDEVLKQWEGLGYYSRARRLHQTANLIRQEYGGRFPRTYEGLVALPGVGPYTAAAIGSLCMGLDVAVVDGNVARVLSRITALPDDIQSTAGKRKLQQLADTCLVSGKAGMVNEAWMELGATVCLPRNPHCGRCPMKSVCRAFQANDVTSFPNKARRGKVPHRHVAAGVIVNRKGEILIARRRDDAMLGGLWEFPGGGQEGGESLEECLARELDEELGITVRVGPKIRTVRHAFSHFTMDLHAYWARIVKGRPRAIECSDFTWTPRSQLRRFAYPKADLVILGDVEQGAIPQF